jgi:amidophosphoribosyltransferase
MTDNSSLVNPSDDRPHEECGIFGIYAPGRDVARMTFFGLYALQHRGQEGAGIATTDGITTYHHKGLGLVSQVFDEDNLRPLKGHMAVGHTRYSTTGSSHVRNVQPYLIETLYGPLGVAHNGNLTNALDLRRGLLQHGVGLSSTSDTEVIAQMLAAPTERWEGAPGEDRWEGRIRHFMRQAEGAYCLVILTRGALYAVRDPHGLRPLCLGVLEDGGHVVASESCALQTIGARYLREIAPGEIIKISKEGVSSSIGVETSRHQRALCIFEYVYFARPDSNLEGQIVHEVRQRMGRQLAKEAPAVADIVVPVPDSAMPAAIGYALELGISFSEGLIKNRYIGRTFIQPDDHLRKVGIHLKFNPLTSNLAGKRVVLVDDSIVRGNTVGPLVQLIREGGATEVHVRVSSPPVRHPCFMGLDMATYKELIAHRMDLAAVCKHIGADSLDYLSLPGLVNAVNAARAEAEGAASDEKRHCTACFSGQYPVNIPKWLFAEDREKLVFEGMWGS